MDDRICVELSSLRRTGGLLVPEDVVEFARNPETALHKHFCWDETEAARQYRLIQARNLIVRVTVTPRGSDKPIQAFVSLKSDRANPGGGYRETIRVLSDADLRDELLSQALRDLEYWQNKYQSLKELAPVFKAAKRVKRSQRSPKVSVAARSVKPSPQSRQAKESESSNRT